MIYVDIVSDTICPWCYIGKRRFERALALKREVYYAVSFTLRTDLHPLEFIQLPGRTGEGVL